MTSDEVLVQIRQQIVAHESNELHRSVGYEPLFAVHPAARLVIVGQAPGIRAQQSGVPWNDASGERLRAWMGLSSEEFHANPYIAHMPMDFYYPGKGASGDLPPRASFAPLWHPLLLEAMPHVELIILVGTYAQRHYLGKRRERNLTETVRNYQEYLPQYFPLVHPSPLNFRWFARNPWFEEVVVPALREEVSRVLSR